MLTKEWILAVAVCALIVSGCGKSDEQKKTPVVPSAAAPVTAEPENTTSESVSPLKPMDEKDDPRFALLFPDSDKVGGWIKTSAVAGGDIQKNLSEYLPRLAGVLSPFPAETIATVKYERIYQDKIESVTIYLIHAATGDDAYGMMSVCVPGADKHKPGEVRRQEKPDEIYAVKGPYFGIFTGQTRGEDRQHMIDGLELLTGKVLFELSDRAEPPRVVQSLQTEQLPAGTTLFMRSLESIKGPAGKEVIDSISLNNVEKLNKLLRLGPKVDFAVTVYTNKDWIGPDVIWLAEYPTREQALEVAKQYRKVLKKAKSSDKLDSNTLLKGPRGRFLLGTWTMDVESATNPHLMNQIQAYLP
ncbi:MAG: hypothetical protein WC975_03980 [Phycisphaerae bacterium]